MAKDDEQLFVRGVLSRRTAACAVLGGHQPAMYIGATFTDWAPNIEMQLEGDTWVADEVQVPAGEQELKFASSEDWSKDDWGNAQGFSGTEGGVTGLPLEHRQVHDLLPVSGGRGRGARLRRERGFVGISSAWSSGR